MGPAEGEGEADNPKSGTLVGRVAVDHEGADSLEEVIEGHLGEAGGVDHVEGGAGGEDDP